MWKTQVSLDFSRIFCPHPLCDNLWQKFLTSVDKFFHPQKIIHFSPKCGGNVSWLVEAALTENGGLKASTGVSKPRRVSPPQRRNKVGSVFRRDMCVPKNTSRPESACLSGAVQAANPHFLNGTKIHSKSLTHIGYSHWCEYPSPPRRSRAWSCRTPRYARWRGERWCGRGC